MIMYILIILYHLIFVCPHLLANANCVSNAIASTFIEKKKKKKKN